MRLYLNPTRECPERRKTELIQNSIMAIISDFHEDEPNEPQKKKASASSQPSSSSSQQPSSFTAKFDPSNPINFLEKVFDFVAQESDFLGKETAEKEIASLVRAATEKKKKRDEEQRASEEERLKAEKRLKEEKAEVRQEKDVKAEDEKDESGKNGKD